MQLNMARRVEKLAKHADELNRNMRLVGPEYFVDATSARVDVEVTMPAGSAPRNPTPVEALTSELYARVDEVYQQLGVFQHLLQELREQAYQAFHRGAADLARETAEVLARLQARTG